MEKIKMTPATFKDVEVGQWFGSSGYVEGNGNGNPIFPIFIFEKKTAYCGTVQGSIDANMHFFTDVSIDLPFVSYDTVWLVDRMALINQ